jgi:hypothetical protein
MCSEDLTVESMPFLHANHVFTITFFEDLLFTEVRGILDHLLDNDAFNPEVQEQRGFYLIDLEDCSFEVWVSDTEVIIKRE